MCIATQLHKRARCLERFNFDSGSSAIAPVVSSPVRKSIRTAITVMSLQLSGKNRELNSRHAFSSPPFPQIEVQLGGPGGGGDEKNRAF
jgi:hypothetical protein